MAMKHTKWQKYIQNGHIICQLFLFQGPQNFFPNFWGFGLKIYHLATLLARRGKRVDTDDGDNRRNSLAPENKRKTKRSRVESQAWSQSYDFEIYNHTASVVEG
jgi:hypothetical protein